MNTKDKKSAGKAVDFKILKRIFSYAIPHKTNLSLAITTTLTLSVIAIIRPLIVKHTLDNYIAIPDLKMLFLMTILMITSLIIEALLQFSDSYLTNKLGQSIIKDLRIKVYEHILNFRLKHYDKTPIGTLVTRAVSDIEVIANIFSEGLIVIMGDILKIIIIIATMMFIDFKLTLFILIPIPLMLIATYLFKKAVAASFNDVRTQVARLNTFVQEHITGISIIQIFNREKVEMKKFEEINGKHRDANIRSIMAYSIFFPVVEILAASSLALLVWWGGKSVLENHTSVGIITAFIMLLNYVFRPIRQLADRFNTLQMGMVSSERVFNLLDTEEQIENNGTQHLENTKGEVEFKNVWFAYNDTDWVLKNVSFKAKSGEKIAIVGATGAGKSSIINLLSRFYEYNKGEILIDANNIRTYELASLQKNIGVVLQDVFLFSDTIYNNITLNNPSIPLDEVIAASKKIGSHDFIAKLPDAYSYNVKERGAMLSVGQRQLISFIRAYIYNPKILILDEATSSIDTESEQLIQEAISKLTENRTSIIIAHRLATIQKADKIIVLDKGEIIEEGNHQELLKLNGAYKRLFELQFSGENILAND